MAVLLAARRWPRWFYRLNKALGHRLFYGHGNGSGVVISQYYGARDYDNLHKSVHTAVHWPLRLVLAWRLSVYFNAVYAALDGNARRRYGAGTEYLSIYFAGIISLTVYNIGSGILRAVGDSKRPLYYLIVAGITNVVLNLVFVIVFNMGVAV